MTRHPKHFLDVATAYVDVDQELRNEIQDRVEELISDYNLDWNKAYDLVYRAVRDGAILYKLNELLREYEEVKKHAGPYTAP
jgi:hypothetical protein